MSFETNTSHFDVVGYVAQHHTDEKHRHLIEKEKNEVGSATAWLAFDTTAVVVVVITRCRLRALGAGGAPEALHHDLGDCNLYYAIGARALGIEDNPGVVVDQIVRIIGKEWVHSRPDNPRHLRIGHRDFFGRLASAAAVARTTTVSVTVLIIAAGGIESR